MVDIYPNSKGGFRVVGFSVEPRSIKHSSAKWDDSKPTENHLQCEISDTLYLSEGKPTEVIFSYDVVWQVILLAQSRNVEIRVGFQHPMGFSLGHLHKDGRF